MIVGCRTLICHVMMSSQEDVEVVEAPGDGALGVWKFHRKEPVGSVHGVALP